MGPYPGARPLLAMGWQGRGTAVTEHLHKHAGHLAFSLRNSDSVLALQMQAKMVFKAHVSQLSDVLPRMQLSCVPQC